MSADGLQLTRPSRGPIVPPLFGPSRCLGERILLSRDAGRRPCVSNGSLASPTGRPRPRCVLAGLLLGGLVLLASLAPFASASPADVTRLPGICNDADDGRVSDVVADTNTVSVGGSERAPVPALAVVGVLSILSNPRPAVVSVSAVSPCCAIGSRGRRTSESGGSCALRPGATWTTGGLARCLCAGFGRSQSEASSLR